jgi:hypothetical protein
MRLTLSPGEALQGVHAALQIAAGQIYNAA